MKKPLKLASRRAPKVQSLALPALPAVPQRTRRIAVLSSACAVVLSVGAGSAMFVDYLADRALARAADTVPVKPIREIRIASNSAVATDADPTGDTRLPAVRPPEIVAKLPIVAAPDNAIEMPHDDPTAEPVVNLDQVETASLQTEDDMTDEVVDDGPTAYQEEADPETVDAPEAAIEATAKAAEPAETELAALPGVDVGGLAGQPAGSTASAGSAKTARIVSAVNMRARGQKGAKVLGVVPAGATVSLFGCDSWCEISYEGRKGYVYKSFVGKAKASPKPEKQASAATEQDARGVQSLRGNDR